MKYSFQNFGESIVALDENGIQERLCNVLDFDRDSVMCFFVDNEGTLEVAGYYLLSSGTIQFVGRYSTLYERLSGDAVDSNGRIVYTGDIDYKKFSKVYAENNWELIAFRQAHEDRMLLFNENGICVRRFDDVESYSLSKKNGQVDFEGMNKRIEVTYGESKKSVRIRYYIDFKRHLVYEFEEIPHCDSWDKYSCEPYYYCHITDGLLTTTKNIAIYHKFSKSIELVFGDPIESVEDIFCYRNELLALARLEVSSDFAYAYVRPNVKKGGYDISKVVILRDCKVKRLQQKYANLVEISPFLQVTDNLGCSSLYLYDRLIAKNNEDFHIIRILQNGFSYDFLHVTEPTIVGKSAVRDMTYVCSGGKIYDIEGNVIKDFNDSFLTKKNKFKILDTCGSFVAGFYEGTSTYDFFVMTRKDNTVVVEPAECRIHKIDERVLIGLMTTRKLLVWYNGEDTILFDVMQNKFVLHPDFKPKPQKQAPCDRYTGASTLNDAFEGEVDLYNDWLMN